MDFHKWTLIGGLKLEQNDFLFEQNAVRRAFFGLLSMIVGGDDKGYILSGCARTSGAPGFFDIAAGFFVLNGEIYEVEAHSVADNGNTEFWEVFETPDPAGNEIFEDTVTRDTYIQRRARVIESASPPGTFTPSLAPGIFDKLKETPALGIDDLETEVDINTLSIADIEDVWLSHTISAGNLKSITGGGDLTNVSGSFRYKIVGKTLHYAFNIGGDLPTGTPGFTFDINTLVAGVTLKSGIGDQSGNITLNRDAGVQTEAGLALYSTGGIATFTNIGLGDFPIGATLTAIGTGSLELN